MSVNTKKVTVDTHAVLDARPIHCVDQLPMRPSEGESYMFTMNAVKDATNLTHNLHKYAAKFIPQIPRWAIDFQSTGCRQTVLDPFCGSGTTLLEAGVRGHHAIGVDVSPLAVLISSAKLSTPEIGRLSPSIVVSRIVSKAAATAPGIQKRLKVGQECLGLHKTWSNWFLPKQMAELLALRDAIQQRQLKQPQLANLLFACLSAKAKACSFLDENQIKVRYVTGKKLKDPFEIFAKYAKEAISKQLEVSAVFSGCGTSFSVQQGTAANLSLSSSSVDRVVTSPPYINAIDYSMAQKYNFFLLGLIAPGEFKDHCREYIGVTERAVRAADLASIPETNIARIDLEISKLKDLNTAVSHNRAFVVAQYFSGMHGSLREMHRVLKPKGKIIMVVGAHNRICGQQIQTGEIVRHLAENVGLTTVLSFRHVLANRSSMRLNRSVTGGTVSTEDVYVFER